MFKDKNQINYGSTFTKQDKYRSVQLNLIVSYSLSEGWEIIPLHRRANGICIPDFIVQRTYRKAIDKIPLS